jgi:hypothetical protein
VDQLDHFRSLFESCHSTAANDLPTSASFSVRKNPQRIQANTPPVFSNLRPHICPHLLRLATKDYSDRLLALPTEIVSGHFEGVLNMLDLRGDGVRTLQQDDIEPAWSIRDVVASQILRR